MGGGQAQSRELLERARRLAGLSRAELARRSGASRPTLAAYAAGDKSPTLSTAERIVGAAGFALDIVPRPAFREAAVGRDLGRDSPAAEATDNTKLGPTLSPRDLAARKTLALFGRAEARDFTDVHALVQPTAAWG